MEQLSFSEKLKVLVDVSSSSGICIASIVLLLFMAFLFLTTTRKNAKSSKKFYLTVYVVLIVSFMGIYSSSLKYMMNNFFIVVYFPNLAIYLAAIIATNIILWVTIFNFKEDKLLKFLNTFIYCVIHYLLILILNIVTKNSLNVFDQTSVYSNHDALALIGLSSTVFIVWIIFLIIYKIIRNKQKSHEKVPVRIRRVIRYKKKLPDSITSISTPDVIQGSLVKKNTASVDLINFYEQQNNILEQQYQNVLREKEQQEKLYQNQKKDQELLKQYDSMLTLDDYKTVLNLLKSSSSKKEDNNVVNEPKIVFSEPISNGIKEEDVEQPKLEELLNLYRSI